MADVTAVLTTALPILGIGIGAALQYIFSRSAEVRKQAYSLKQQAYVDYLRAMAQAGHAHGPEELGKARLLAADAKTRIVVYGDSRVIEALAKFEEAGPSLTNPRSTRCFLSLALAMRARADVTETRLRTVLLGPPRSPDASDSGAAIEVERPARGMSEQQ